MNTDKVYEGIVSRNGCSVLVNGKPLPLERSLKIRNHSPSGFGWGYLGSGPAQLALAILLDYYDNAGKAERLYQPFKRCVVAAWDIDDGWKITGAEIDHVCAGLEKERP